MVHQQKVALAGAAHLELRLGEGHTTQLQALNVRCHVTAAANCLDWQASNGLTLGTCTQAAVEQWGSAPDVTYRNETGHFIRWSVQHRHASDLTFGTIRWTGPTSTIDSEKRWDDARRLLHDNSLPTQDRVAGRFLLLYAQKIARITQLTVDDPQLGEESVTITFGTAPVVLPASLADLVRALVSNPCGKAKIGTPDAVPWLFSGGRPGVSQRSRRESTAISDGFQPPYSSPSGTSNGGC
ncbi:hypothetical protein [Streptomyces sp. NPDC098781]|uniref:hypothetical protein n=1 Tax=Streptomyces sp. NPDC098781 TaxID=3366097 RepID=UPI0038035E3C